MGMFDYLRCEYPLPGDVPLDTASFHYQTKDFDCMLYEYTITKDGLVTLDGEPLDFTGDVYFYDSNVVASGPGTYTKDGEDSHWLEYQAVFIHGKLTHIELIRYESEPAQKSSQMWRNQPKFANEEERMAWWKNERKKFEDWQNEERQRRASTSQAK